MEKRWWYLLPIFLMLYRPILGLVLVFFLPGFGFVLNFFKKTKWHEKIALTLALSLSLVILNGLILNATIGLNFFSVIIPLLLVSLIPLFIYLKNNKLAQFKKPDKQQLMGIGLLLFCLVILAVHVYKPHFDNPYPIHLDEYSRLLETTHIIEKGTNNFMYNPQFLGNPSVSIRNNPGFQFILSQFYIISDVDQITFFQYMPTIFALITAFILFSFLTKISNYWTGIFAILLLAFLKTNDNTLGISFLIALTMVFPLLYAIFYNIHNFFNEKKVMYLLLASFVYFAVLVTHEQTGAAFFPIILLYLIVGTIFFFIKNKRNFSITTKGILISLAALIVPLFSLYVAKSWLWKGSFAKSIEFFLDLIVWEGTSTIRYPYNFLVFYGIIFSVLAIFGVIMLYKNKNMSVFLIWSLIAIAQVINFRYNSVTYFSYIERVRHHAVLGLVPLSAYGIYHLIRIVSNFFKKYNKERIIGAMAVFVVIVLSVSSLVYVDKGAYLPEGKRPLNGEIISFTINKADYNAILFLKNISKGRVVLANPDVSAAIYPISKNYIIASSQSLWGGGNVQDVVMFFSGSCMVKRDIAYGNKVRYVLSTRPIRCPAFNKIYSEDFRYIYEVQ